MDDLSPYLISAALACLAAQGLKMALAIGSRPSNWRSLFKSGHMPSTHSSTVSALAASIAYIDGLGSPATAIAIVFAIFFMYDAMRVRRATGEQGEVIDALIDKSGAKITKPYYARGHKPAEVLAGAALGTSVGLLVAFFATK